MSLPDECRHWTTPRWLSCIYERLLSPFSVNVAGALPLPTGAATSANQTTANTSLASIAGMSIPPNDFISLGYTGSNLTSVIYKLGGSGGTTVATLTLAYTGSDLISVTKS
jgi:hypothetical protein